MSPSSGGHLRVFWGLFWHITPTFWEPCNMFCEILYRRSWCSFWGSLHYFFSISWPSWGALGGSFGLILGNVYLILNDYSIFSHQILYGCFWYNLDGHYTQKTFYIMPSLCWGSSWGILGRILAHVHIFSRYSFNILSWNFAQVFLVWLWLSLILFLTSCPHLQGVI